MTRRRAVAEFPAADKIKLLPWCDRHCCLCGTACGVDIEIAHLDEKGPGVIDNAIPLCYDCHAKIGHYNEKHPRGNRYKPAELTARREQIYERYTRHLVPPLQYLITQELTHGAQRRLPDVGFNILHRGDSLPAQALVKLNICLGERDLGAPVSNRLYDGTTAWNLNPRHGIRGWFSVPDDAVQSAATLEIVVAVTVIDQYQRPHALLPVSWVLIRDQNAWFAHPAPRQL